jgi:hypothetical protein
MAGRAGGRAGGDLGFRIAIHSGQLT